MLLQAEFGKPCPGTIIIASGDMLIDHHEMTEKLLKATTFNGSIANVLLAKSDSDVMFCLQSYQGLIIDRSLVY